MIKKIFLAVFVLFSLSSCSVLNLFQATADPDSYLVNYSIGALASSGNIANGVSIPLSYYKNGRRVANEEKRDSWIYKADFSFYINRKIPKNWSIYSLYYNEAMMEEYYIEVIADTFPTKEVFFQGNDYDSSYKDTLPDRRFKGLLALYDEKGNLVQALKYVRFKPDISKEEVNQLKNKLKQKCKNKEILICQSYKTTLAYGME